MNLPDHTFVRMRVPKNPDTGEISCMLCRMMDYYGYGLRCNATGSCIEYDYLPPKDCPFIIALKEDEHDR